MGQLNLRDFAHFYIGGYRDPIGYRSRGSCGLSKGGIVIQWISGLATRVQEKTHVLGKGQPSGKTKVGLPLVPPHQHIIALWYTMNHET